MLGRAYRLSGESWAERVAAALEALVELFTAEPYFARLFTVEVLGAGTLRWLAATAPCASSRFCSRPG